jgi:hypothetical protein
MWRMDIDFSKAEKSILSQADGDEFYLASSGKTVQRESLRIKNKTKWLLLEMKTPSLTIIRNFQDKLDQDIITTDT